MGGHAKRKKTPKGKDLRRTRTKKGPAEGSKFSSKHRCANAPPRDDDDINGIPPMPSTAMLPVKPDDNGADVRSEDLRTGTGTRRDIGISRKQAMVQEKKRKFDAQNSADEKELLRPDEPRNIDTLEDMEGISAFTIVEGPGEAMPSKGAGKKEEQKIELPSKKKNESMTTYMARLDKATENKLREASAPLTSERRRQKRREKKFTKRKEAAEKRKAREANSSRGGNKKERVHIGDVVERPPLLSEAALQSRTKLKTFAKGHESTVPQKGPALHELVNNGTSRSGKSSSRIAQSEFAEYASKVKDAYDAMRRKRLGM